MIKIQEKKLKNNLQLQIDPFPKKLIQFAKSELNPTSIALFL